MTENVSFNKQEHHILIKNNVRKDGTLINDKNKVAFTIGNYQLNDNNIKKGGTSKSLFRMNSTYRPSSSIITKSTRSTWITDHRS